MSNNLWTEADSRARVRRYRTRTMGAIEAALAKGKPGSVRQIRMRAQDFHSVSLRTVRGHLYSMVRQGRLTRLDPPDVKPLYVLTKHAHGSWFMCRGCQRIEVLDQDRPLDVVVEVCWKCEKRREEAVESSLLSGREEHELADGEAAAISTTPPVVAAETEAPAAVKRPDPYSEPVREPEAAVARPETLASNGTMTDKPKAKPATLKPNPEVLVRHVPAVPPPSPGPDPRNWKYDPNRDWNRPIHGH